MISGEKLKIIRLACRWPQNEFAEALGILQPHLSAMEGGMRAVPTSVAQKACFLTGFSLRYLATEITETVPAGNFLWYRKQRNKYRKGEENQAYCQLVFDTFEPLTKRLKPRICRLASLSDCSPSEAAGHVRSALGLRPGIPVENITIAAENAGVRVIGIPKPVLSPSVESPDLVPELDSGDDFDAFSFWTQSRLPVIFIRSDLEKAKYNWAIGHELTHLVMHNTFHGQVRVAEGEAQTAAEELFLPEASFTDLFPRDRISVRYIEHLAQMWNVAYESILLRALKLQLTNDRNNRYYRGAMKHGAGKSVVIRSQRPRFYRQMCEQIFGIPVAPEEVARQTGAARRLIFDVLDAHSGKPDTLCSLTARVPERFE